MVVSVPRHHITLEGGVWAPGWDGSVCIQWNASVPLIAMMTVCDVCFGGCRLYACVLLSYGLRTMKRKKYKIYSIGFTRYGHEKAKSMHNQNSLFLTRMHCGGIISHAKFLVWDYQKRKENSSKGLSQ